jgi:hypothetical protein
MSSQPATAAAATTASAATPDAKASSVSFADITARTAKWKVMAAVDLTEALKSDASPQDTWRFLAPVIDAKYTINCHLFLTATFAPTGIVHRILHARANIQTLLITAYEMTNEEALGVALNCNRVMDPDRVKAQLADRWVLFLAARFLPELKDPTPDTNVKQMMIMSAVARTEKSLVDALERMGSFDA